jgi:hypothetical protein
MARARIELRKERPRDRQTEPGPFGGELKRHCSIVPDPVLSPARSTKQRSAVSMPNTIITGHEEGRRDGAAPVSCRRAPVDLSDDVATRVQSLFYLDAADALRKALNES